YETSSIEHVDADTDALTLRDKASWTVYNIEGQMVTTIDGVFTSSSLLPGIYIVKGHSSSNRSLTTKIVVK
ncbi:MAG: T9SS type A sorting domain-containing protein, partial [Muribaculaceae bacterium]|nr:T9SS type A sorting domain-containing protein [Muribaculaceae bacterium]